MQNYADKSKKIENKLTEKKKKQIYTNNNIKNNTESLLMEKNKWFCVFINQRLTVFSFSHGISANV